MTSQDFNIGDEVFVTGRQDGVEFNNTPCMITSFRESYIRTPIYEVCFNKKDTPINPFGNDNVLMRWWVRPDLVEIKGTLKDYDPSQQPYTEDDI